MAKPAEAGRSADEVREFDVSLELKLSEVQEEAFAVAEAAAAATSSDERVAVKAAVAEKGAVELQWRGERGSLLGRVKVEPCRAEQATCPA